MKQLTDLTGIGRATAEKLTAAGFASVAALAAADRASPPEGIAADDWGKWIDQAIAEDGNTAPPSGGETGQTTGSAPAGGEPASGNAPQPLQTDQPIRRSFALLSNVMWGGRIIRAGKKPLALTEDEHTELASLGAVNPLWDEGDPV
jgi:helix-hairpin-helix protein